MFTHGLLSVINKVFDVALPTVLNEGIYILFYLKRK